MWNMLYMPNWDADGMYGWTISLYDCKTHRRISNKMYRYKWCCHLTSVAELFRWVNMSEQFKISKQISWIISEKTMDISIHHLRYLDWRYRWCVGLCKGYVRECKAVTLSIVLLFLEASSWHAAICTSWSTGPKLGGSSGLDAARFALAGSCSRILHESDIFHTWFALARVFAQVE